MDTRIKAAPIQARTKGEMKRLRKNGFIPVSLQHKGEETRHYQIPLKSLLEFMRHHGESALIELEMDQGGAETALIHDIHRDGVTHLPTQVTFQRVVRGEPVKAHVPIVFQGEPEPVADGTAVVQPNLTTLEVRCLPGDLPEQVSLNVAGMHFGDVLHVSDVQVGSGVEILSAPDTIVVSLASLLRRAAEEEEPAALLAEPAVEPVEDQAQAA